MQREEFQISMRKGKNRKEKRKMIGWIIGLIVVGLAIAAGVGWTKAGNEHKEILSLSFEQIDFDNLKDGIYEGYFEGGMYGWRENRIRITVDSGMITDIRVLEHKENQSEEFTGGLFGRVLEERSLEVDAVSGATLTSRAYLKGLEDALKKAQKQD
jgi:uncharacterized protein with FMN-binding domain